MDKCIRMWPSIVAHTEKILKDPFYATESPKNIPEWYLALKQILEQIKLKSLKLFHVNSNTIHTNI